MVSISRRRLPSLRVAISLGLVASFAITATVAASPAATVVKPSSMNGWLFFNDNTNAVDNTLGSFVSGPGTTPSGNGSVRINAGSGERKLLLNTAHNGTALSDITALSYSTYRSSADSGNNLALTVQFGWDNDTTDVNTGFRGRLVFEPYFSAPGGVPQNTWQSWNPLTASSGWWTTMSGATLCTQSSPCSWEQVQADYPNAAIPSSAYGFVGVRGGDAAIDGNIDTFVFGTASGTTVYDFDAETQCTTTCYVNAATGNDAFGGDTPAAAKKTIQAAVSQVNSGGTVQVAAGTYNEQVVADHNLTIDGAGAGTTSIKAPASMVAGTDPGRFAIVEVRSGANVEMSDLTVSGPGPSGCGSLHYGILVTGAAHLNAHDMTIADIRDSSLSGCQNGNGIQVGRQAISQTGTADVDNVTVTGYQKTGLIVDNTGSSMTVTDSTITGVGATAAIAQNGIQISRGATASVSDSSISSNEYSGTGADSTDILLFQAGNNVSITGNDISNADVGIDLSSTAGTGIVASHNSIHGNGAGVDNGTISLIDATCNWWGSSTGPGTVGLGTGDTVSSNVDFTPWLITGDLNGDCTSITVHGTGAADANGNEGSLISTSGSFNGSIASITADNTIGTFTPNAGAGTWTWSYTPVDQFSAATINVTGHGTNGTTAVDTFSTSAANVNPTATFTHPTSQLFSTGYTLSLDTPNDPSAVDTAEDFSYQFNCGAGYVSTGSTNGFNCTAPSTPGSIMVKGKITDKDGGSTEYTASVTITQQDITVSDASGHNFGDQNINAGAGAPFTFTVTNDGNADLTLGSVSIVGSNATSFIVDTDNCGGEVLAPTHSCTIEVVFDPVTVNGKNATLRIASNDPNENPTDRALTGNGTNVVATNGTITIVLDSRPDDAQSFTFTGGLGSFNLTDPANKTLIVSKPAGDYVVQATKVNGWSLKSLTCTTSETIRKAKGKVTIHLASGENTTCTFTESKRLADESIALTSGGTYNGVGIYSGTAQPSQTQNQAIGVGQTKSFFVHLTNNSLDSDSFNVFSTLTGSTKFAVKFFNGATDVTARVNAGTYNISLNAGQTATVQVQVKALAGAPASATRNVDLTMKSKSSTSKDVVRGHVTRV